MDTPVERRSSVWVIIDCCWPSTRRASMEETLVLMLDMIAPKEMPIPSGVLNGRGFLPSKFDSPPDSAGNEREHIASTGHSIGPIGRLPQFWIDFPDFAVIGLYLARSLHHLPLGDPRGGNSPFGATAHRRTEGWFHWKPPLIFLPNGLPNLLAVDGDRLWGPDPQADFVAADIDDGDFNVVTKHDGFHRDVLDSTSIRFFWFSC